MRIPRRQVHFLYRGKTDYDEPIPHQSGGNECGEDGLPEKPRAAHLERLAGYGHKDRGPPDRTGHHGVLRHLFQWVRRLHTPATEDLRKGLLIDDRNHAEKQDEDEGERTGRIERMIDEMERRRKELKVEELSFNSFYEFSVQRIPDICAENHISGIDISTYRYMMKDFYRGGNHEKTLNENMDSSLFDETFIVFEIDSIKDDPLLFPLVTLIIMDVFLQKMRIKKNRKVLVIEEAWKAIASPLMAEYIKFDKTARKFWASVGVVTQEIQDIIGSPIVKEAIINNSDVVMLLDQSKFRERFDEIKAILGLTDVDCKKDIHHQPAGKQGRAQLLPRGVHPPGDDQRRVRRGRTKRVLHDLHHRAGGERSPETLQAGIAVQPSGSYRGVLSGLERQRYRKIPAVRPKGQRGRADIEPSCKTITIKSSITENGKDRHQPKCEDT